MPWISQEERARQKAERKFQKQHDGMTKAEYYQAKLAALVQPGFDQLYDAPIAPEQPAGAVIEAAHA
jgi:hypothetical protein